MAHIDIDGKTYEAENGDNLLSACLSLGLDLPYFCWHPALGSAGACRQCAVIQYKDAEDKKGRLVMACLTPVADGLRVSLDAEAAQKFRADNIELLMTNHPHDCPVCEEGGECHLQDMTEMTGHTFRRYRGLKRTHRNQDLGPFINHEMNRCIACYRCVRFYDEYAGGKDLQVFGIHNNVYFGRFQDGALENEFSGNLVEVCPTGVFTDKTFSAHYARKWDLQSAPSICVHCGLGCNTSPGERYGTLRRIVNRYHADINGYFLCDRGRFGYGFVNSPERIRQPRLKGDTGISAETALSHFRGLLNNGTTIGIGSPRASLEANFALRTLVGEDNFFLGLDDTEHRLLDLIVKLMFDGGIHSPSLREIEQADAVLILGEDVTHSAPRLALSLRQAARNASFELAGKLRVLPWQDAAVRNLQPQARTPVFIAGITATRLDDIATHTYFSAPEDIARLGFAIAHALDASAPILDTLHDGELALAATIAGILKQAKRPLIVSGTGCGNEAVIQSAYNVAKALPQADKQLSFIVPECNSIGLALIGGKPLAEAFECVGNGLADTVVILENDLYRRAPERNVDLLLQLAAHAVVIDSLDNRTAKSAELVLPAATFAESEGTLVNNEGRAQRYFPVYPAAGAVRGSWQWLTSVMDNASGKKPSPEGRLAGRQDDCMDAGGRATHGAVAEVEQRREQLPRGNQYKEKTDFNPPHPGLLPQGEGERTPRSIDINKHWWQYHDELTAACAEAIPNLAGIVQAAPGASNDDKIPRQPHRYSGRTAMHANINVREPVTPQDIETPFSFSMEGDSTQPMSPIAWAPGWNSNQAVNKIHPKQNAGVRLIDAAGSLPWFSEIPARFEPAPGRWRIVELPHIFVSDELSLHAPPLLERRPPYGVLLNPLDAANLKIAPGDTVEIGTTAGVPVLNVPVRIEPALPSGLLGITAGLPEFQPVARLGLVTLKKLHGEGGI
jgi:NADH-quinone oxidoreductase subunit G